MDRSAYLDSLWALLPREHRAEFHAKIMADPNNDYFRDGPDDSPAGRFFVIAVGDPEAYAPAALEPISVILQALVYDGSLAADQLPDFRDIIIANLQTMLNDLDINYPEAPAAPAGGRRGYKNTRKHNRKNHRSRKNRKHSRKGRK